MSPRILLTGASSFSGFWFAKVLAEQGFQVTALLQKKQLADYSGVRKQRIENLSDKNLGIELVFDCPLGSSKTIALLKEKKHWDFLGLHGAFVTNYKSQDFDFLSALKNNIENLEEVIKTFTQNQGQHLIHTGTVFESNEGVGNAPLKAASPYGLSKNLTNEVIKFYCERHRIKMGKFVLANPFGTFEEEKLTTYLMRSWIQDQTPTMSFPDYIRDNIHVELLAKVYAHFCLQLKSSESSYLKINPSGYVESQGSFTLRFANEMTSRLQKKCSVTIAKQSQFTEPYMRINTDPATHLITDWDEKKAWDQIASHYQEKYRHTS
ncbi:MAG: NAD-dependent epimerase/dehydratase family protein [Bdellovibrionaceae bacterium]|nr:NAD-dependent epimerase/dehydratase family protein [Pseudobdellovibrionaceae bacterium]